MSAATMTAGRELDALIAEKVMGYWDVGEYEGRLVHGEHNMNGWPVDTPHYSTDIAAAWPVAHQMGPRYPEFFVALSRLLDDETDFLRPLAGLLAMPANEAAWFICRAALETVEASR